MRFYNDQEREEWASSQNELALDFMKRLANAEENARRQESLLRHTIQKMSNEKRDLETHLRHEIGLRLSRTGVYTDKGLTDAVYDEMRALTQGQR